MSYWYSIITRASCWASIWAVTQERRLTRPAVLFNHVPSTGGSTWEVLWSRYACASNLTACPYSEAVGRTISADRPASGTPYCKPSDDVVASHMTPAGFRALRAARAAYLPQKKYLTVTMVREPCGATLARFLHPQHAHHSIVRSVALGAPNATTAFEVALNEWIGEIASGGHAAKYLYVQTIYLFGARLKSEAAANEALRSYDFVGLTEQFDASVLKVFSMIGCSPPAYVLTNSAASKADAEKGPISRVGALRAKLLRDGSWYRVRATEAAADGDVLDDFYLYAASEKRFVASGPPSANRLASYRASFAGQQPPMLQSAWFSGNSRVALGEVDYSNAGNWRAHWIWPLSCVRAPQELVRDACEARCTEQRVHLAAWSDFIDAVVAGCPACQP